MYKMPIQSGRAINQEFVQSIVKGRTTMGQVRTALGAPQTRTVSGDEETWTFTHWEGKPALFGNSYQSSKTQMLTVKFKNQKVLDYSHTTAGS